MPTYEYRCTACGHGFEAFQKMSDDPVEECPECGRPEAERLMSAGAGLVFKGSGFYETDYKKSGRGESGPEGEGGEASGPEDGGGEPAADAGDAAESGAEKGGESAA